MLFYHFVLLRSKDRSQFLGEFYILIERLLRKDGSLAEWYLNQIGEPFLREFLFDSLKEIKFAVMGVIQVALKHCKANPEFVRRCMGCLARRGMTPFARIFYILGGTSK